MTSSMVTAFLFLLAVQPVVGLEGQVNPIRKIVTLMQNMQKEIEGEGAKEKELFDKFMCYCNGGAGDLKKGIADASQQIEQLSAQVSSEEAEKAQTAQELKDHKNDRESAKNDLSEATMLREKEANEFAATKADSDTNIASMASAIPAIEKGMGGSALLQMPAAKGLHKIVQDYTNVDPVDRKNVLSFLEQSGDYVPQSGQIVGILKAMKDDMEASLKQATADEQSAIAGFADLKASKQKEINMATEAIETKTERNGQLAVSVVQSKDSLEDTQKELADTQKFAAQLDAQCGTKAKEWAERSNMRSMEISAISEAISILNDDDALDVFKKALPSVLVQNVGFLQHGNGKASASKRALAILSAAVSQAKSTQLRVMLFAMKSKMKAASEGGFDDVLKMIDDMVVLLGKQQKDDENQKKYCEDEFDNNADDTNAAKTKLRQVDAELSEQVDKLSTLMEEINTLTAGIAALDKSVAEATEQRKQEHADYVSLTQMNEVAKGLVEKAKNRLQKFYNPTLYKAPPKTEMSMEEKKLQAAGGFVQVHVHRVDVAPGPAPETFEGEYKKSGAKSAGVMSLMDTIIKDLSDDTKDAEYEEKTAQKDYSELMADAQQTRAGDASALTGKEKTKAEAENQMVVLKENRAATSKDLQLAQSMNEDLHKQCDFIIQNFDMRKEARTTEMDSLKNAKAVLSGASFSL